MSRSMLPLLTLALGVGFASSASAAEWPEWLGPDREGVWKEEGVVERLPEELKVKWRAEVSGGYSGPAVAGGRVFVTDYVRDEGDPRNSPGRQNELQGRERVLCFDAESGEQIWKHEYDRPYEVSYPVGPRATPTVDGERVYTLGTMGDLLCLDVASGEVLWSKSFQDDYGVEPPFWGHSASPLVEGDLLISIVGGDGTTVVAFDKKSGEEVWTALSAPSAGYCSPNVIEAGGVRQLLIWHPQSLNSLNPKTGEVTWSIPLQPDNRMSIAMPRKSGEYLYASGIGNTAALMNLDSQKPGAEIVWRGDTTTAVYCSNSTPLIEDGVIYGADCQRGDLRGVDLKTGERLWSTFAPTTGGERRASHGTAFLVRHNDRYFLFSETGDLILARLSREGYKELGREHVLEPTSEAFGRSVVWSHPAFANRGMYARNDKELVCVSLAADDYE